jgi:hypothetical protein
MFHREVIPLPALSVVTRLRSRGSFVTFFTPVDGTESGQAGSQPGDELEGWRGRGRLAAEKAGRWRRTRLRTLAEEDAGAAAVGPACARRTAGGEQKAPSSPPLVDAPETEPPL